MLFPMLRRLCKDLKRGIFVCPHVGSGVGTFGAGQRHGRSLLVLKVSMGMRNDFGAAGGSVNPPMGHVGQLRLDGSVSLAVCFW
jgi:hypothetical protein